MSFSFRPQILATSLLVSLMMLAGGRDVHAAFGVMPMEVEQKLPASNTVTDDIEVHNGGEETLFISSSIQDWDLDRHGEYSYATAGTQERSCAPWIQLNPAQFIVAPGKSVRVRYTITAPAPIDATRWAMIFFQSRPLPVKDAPQMGLMMSTRVGCKVILSPQSPVGNQAEIADMVVRTAAGRNAVQVSVRNPGSTIYRARGTAEIRDEKDTVVAKGDLSSAQVLPGHTRDLQLVLPQPLPEGKYNLQVQVDAGMPDLLGGELSFKIPAPTTTP